MSIGTTVSVTNLDTRQPEAFSILGAWDSDPDKNIISYLAPVAQKLLNKKVGEEVELDAENGAKRYRIVSIEQAPLPAAAEEPAAV